MAVTPRPKELAQVWAEAQGLKSEPWPRYASPASVAFVSGVVLLTGHALPAGMVINGVGFVVTAVAAAGGTLLKVGLYDDDPTTVNQLAVSANSAALADTTGAKKLDFITPYTVLDDGLFYAAFLCVNAGANATTLRGAGIALGQVAFSGGVRPSGIQTGQSDLDATVTIANGTNPVYLALY